MSESVQERVASPSTLQRRPPEPPPGEREDAVEQRVFRIKPSRRFFSLDLRELWQYRELLFLLVWRDVKVRYKQTLLGVTWALIQPVATMVIFAVIFGHLAGIPSEYNVPYALFVYVGLLPWIYFASSLMRSSTSLVGNSTLVTRVYFPRVVLPLASIVAPLIDFLIAFGVLLVLFFYYGRTPHWHVVVTPFFLGMAMLTALGVGLWLSALNVRYRDVPYALPFLTQLWMYASPVIYPVGLIPEDWQWLLALNPMAGVIDGFRWAVLGTGLPHYDVWAMSAAVSVVLMVGGLVYFKHVERYFADLI